jgi:hypothetical protein
MHYAYGGSGTAMIGGLKVRTDQHFDKGYQKKRME